jgi:hypothetical protein
VEDLGFGGSIGLACPGDGWTDGVTLDLGFAGCVCGDFFFQVVVDVVLCHGAFRSEKDLLAGGKSDRSASCGLDHALFPPLSSFCSPGFFLADSASR